MSLFSLDELDALYKKSKSESPSSGPPSRGSPSTSTSSPHQPPRPAPTTSLDLPSRQARQPQGQPSLPMSQTGAKRVYNRASNRPQARTGHRAESSDSEESGGGSSSPEEDEKPLQRIPENRANVRPGHRNRTSQMPRAAGAPSAAAGLSSVDRSAGLSRAPISSNHRGGSMAQIRREASGPQAGSIIPGAKLEPPARTTSWRNSAAVPAPVELSSNASSTPTVLPVTTKPERPEKAQKDEKLDKTQKAEKIEKAKPRPFSSFWKSSDDKKRDTLVDIPSSVVASESKPKQSAEPKTSQDSKSNPKATPKTSQDSKSNSKATPLVTSITTPVAGSKPVAATVASDSPNFLPQSLSATPLASVLPKLNEPLPSLGRDMADLESILSTFAKKKYTEGYLYKKNEINSNGTPVKATDPPSVPGDENGRWIKYWAELRGTRLKLWHVPEHIISLTYDPAPTIEKVLKLELSPSPSALATIKNANPNPVVLDVSDSVQEVLPQHFQVKQGMGLATPPPVPYTNLFAISTEGSNLQYMASLSTIQTNTWVAAIRLALFESAKINELFSLKLLRRGQFLQAWKDIGVNPFHTSAHSHEIKYEGMLEVRYTYANEWKPYHVVIKRGGSGSLTKKLFGAKKKNLSSLIPSEVDSQDVKRQILFYETKNDVKRGNPVFSMEVVHMAYMIRPEPLELVEQSAAAQVRLEGWLSLPSGDQVQGKKRLAVSASATHVMKDTFALVGPEGYASTADEPLKGFADESDGRPVPYSVTLRGISTDDISRWLIAILGTFNLDSDVDRREREVADGELGVAKRVATPLRAGKTRGNVSDSGSESDNEEYSSGTLWGLIYLAVDEIAGLNMQGEVYPSVRSRLSEVLRDKQQSKREGFLVQWNDAVVAGEDGRREYEIREVEHKTAELVKLLETAIKNEKRKSKKAARKSVALGETLAPADQTAKRLSVAVPQGSATAEDVVAELVDEMIDDAVGNPESAPHTSNPPQDTSTRQVAETHAAQGSDSASENSDSDSQDETGKSSLPNTARPPHPELGTTYPGLDPSAPMMMVPVPVQQPSGQWVWQYQYVDPAAEKVHQLQLAELARRERRDLGIESGSEGETESDESGDESDNSQSKRKSVIPGLGALPGMPGVPLAVRSVPPPAPVIVDDVESSDEEASVEKGTAITSDKPKRKIKHLLSGAPNADNGDEPSRVDPASSDDSDSESNKASGQSATPSDEESDENSVVSSSNSESGSDNADMANRSQFVPPFPGMMQHIPGMGPMLVGPNGMLIGPNGMPLPMPGPHMHHTQVDEPPTLPENATPEQEEQFRMYAPQSLLAQLNERGGKIRRPAGPLVQLTSDVQEQQEQRLGRGLPAQPPVGFLPPPDFGGPLLGRVDKEENKRKVMGGLLAQVDQREKEKAMLKKMGMYRPQVAGGYLPSYLRGGPGGSMQPHILAQQQQQAAMVAAAAAGAGMPMGMPPSPFGMPPMGMSPMGMPPMGMPGLPPPPMPGMMSPHGYGYPVSEYGDPLEDPHTAMQREALRQQFLERERAKERQRMSERQSEYFGPMPQSMMNSQQFMWRRDQSYSGSSSHSDHRQSILQQEKSEDDEDDSESASEGASNSDADSDTGSTGDSSGSDAERNANVSDAEGSDDTDPVAKAPAKGKSAARIAPKGAAGADKGKQKSERSTPSSSETDSQELSSSSENNSDSDDIPLAATLQTNATRSPRPTSIYPPQPHSFGNYPPPLPNSQPYGSPYGPPQHHAPPQSPYGYPYNQHSYGPPYQNQNQFGPPPPHQHQYGAGGHPSHHPSYIPSPATMGPGIRSSFYGGGSGGGPLHPAPHNYPPPHQQPPPKSPKSKAKKSKSKSESKSKSRKHGKKRHDTDSEESSLSEQGSVSGSESEGPVTAPKAPPSPIIQKSKQRRAPKQIELSEGSVSGDEEASLGSQGSVSDHESSEDNDSEADRIAAAAAIAAARQKRKNRRNKKASATAVADATDDGEDKATAAPVAVKTKKSGVSSKSKSPRR
ncbi:hypothetical protein DFS34DRAFT_140113 [Phlyctochytrium arcticum]|nr:hypothetical protein DFS34DRAFT_140113 [Phlyctochytrium arcticum]